jgi:hypothetical protein
MPSQSDLGAVERFITPAPDFSARRGDQVVRQFPRLITPPSEFSRTIDAARAATANVRAPAVPFLWPGALPNEAIARADMYGSAARIDRDIMSGLHDEQSPFGDKYVMPERPDFSRGVPTREGFIEPPSLYQDVMPPPGAPGQNGAPGRQGAAQSLGKGEVSVRIAVDGPGHVSGASARSSGNMQVSVGVDNTGAPRGENP